MSIRNTYKEYKKEYLSYQHLRFEGRRGEGSAELLGPLYQLISEHVEIAGLTNQQGWDLAGLLLDFAADVHGQCGLWASYEQYNRPWFGTALPLTMANEVTLPPGLHYERVLHFLWVMIPEMTGDEPLSPGDESLHRLCPTICTFLKDRSGSLPSGETIHTYLNTSNRYAWDVKRKLVWLGTQSYLFRLFHGQYLAEHNHGRADIGCTDDFICQQCTPWPGLGVIDILAGVLDLRAEERQDLRHWYERHMAPFLIRSANNEALTARNIINDQPYTIRMNDENQPFKAGDLVIGSLTPWRGEWYWSGQQRRYEKPTTDLMDSLKQTMIRQSSNLIYRYCPEREQQARKFAAQNHEQALKWYGKDLVVYSDGLAMAADWQRQMRQKWEVQPPEVIKETMARHGLKQPAPEMTLPPELLNCKSGLGLFLNPEEGQEIMREFDSLLEGFRRNGDDLTNWQEEAIRGFIRSESISPAFVQRVVKEYGGASLKAAFGLEDTQATCWLDYLLRRYKGHFFRKRYPTISVV